MTYWHREGREVETGVSSEGIGRRRQAADVIVVSADIGHRPGRFQNTP